MNTQRTTGQLVSINADKTVTPIECITAQDKCSLVSLLERLIYLVSGRKRIVLDGFHGRVWSNVKQERKP